MNKRRYSNRKRKNILRVFIFLMTIIIIVVMWRTIKIDVQVGELTLPKILQSEKSFADTSGEWNLILVDRNHYIPNNYQVELTELSNGKKVDSRIYPELQQMFNDARAEGLALFVREGYRTTEEQQKIMDEKINEYEKQGYSAKEAKKRAEKYVAIPDTSEHQLGLSVDINADTDKCSSEKVYQWLDENAYKYGVVKRYPEDKIDIRYGQNLGIGADFLRRHTHRVSASIDLFMVLQNTKADSRRKFRTILDHVVTVCRVLPHNGKFVISEFARFV